MCSVSHIEFHDVGKKTTQQTFCGTEYNTLVSNHSIQVFCSYRRRNLADGQMDGRMDGWMDGRTDGHTG